MTCWKVVLIVVAVMFGAAAQAEKRVALIIGNSAYQSAPVLANPVNDAAAMGEALERLGFEVLVGLDQTGQALRDLTYRFSLAAEGADLALFFYAGHGIQVAGQNYLIPVDAEVDREADLDFSAVALPLILKQMERSARNSIVLLDACRDNPFETRLSRSMGSARSSAALGRGLAPIETLGGALIGFATDPGEVAYDGAGDHSPFTEALLTHIETPGLEVNTLMTRVRADVVASTEQRQRPWATSSLLNELYLAPSQPVESPTEAEEQDPAFEDIAAWRQAQDIGTLEAYQTYLERFPDGLLAAQAKTLIDSLTEQPTDLLAMGTPRARPLRDTFKPLVAAPPEETGRFVTIPGGTFQMGSDSAAAGAEERPVQTVTLPSFRISRGEVTVGEFRAFVEATGHTTGDTCFVWTEEGRMRRRTAGWSDPGFAATNDMPAACVNWQDAVAYANWLSADLGQPVRLPSEAELEYVIRAGTTGDYPFEGGAQGACAAVNAADAASRFRWSNKACEDGHPTVAAAGDLVPNAFGLVATTGNLWEWTADCWAPSHRGASGTGDARNSGQCESRVLRGGSWDDPLENLRSSYRVGIPASRRQANVGFRVVVGE